MFDKDVTKIEYGDNEMIIFEGTYDHNTELLMPLPAHFCRSDNMKASLLTFSSCSDAIGYMNELFELMLRGE